MVFGQKTRKNTSKMIDRLFRKVYNINIKQNQARKRRTQCSIEKNGNVSRRWKVT